jgi:salicylate hydroxylase
MTMDTKVAVVGGGIGGLAAALACTRAGAQVQLLEQAPVFGEVGAGVQLGPNVVRVLQGWGLRDALGAVASFPSQLEVRHALTTRLLGVLPLGRDMVQRYGAAYVTLARSDLHRALLGAVQRSGSAELLLGRTAHAVSQTDQAVQVHTLPTANRRAEELQADALVGADGVWSQVRSAVVQDGAPRATGHLAYRAMVRQADLPAGLRSQVVTAWLGPHFHVVQYPVGAGEYLNVVAIVQGGGKGAEQGAEKGAVPGALQGWDHSANAGELRALLAYAGGGLLDLVHAIGQWRLWPVVDRAPMRSAAEHAKGRIALLGDAAHPMRPYLAQGAGMAIEDAAALARALSLPHLDVPQALGHYASQRYRRNARVQARAVRNGEIFHATGLTRMGRDLALRVLGRRLMDLPWLYSGG